MEKKAFSITCEMNSFSIYFFKKKNQRSFNVNFKIE
jgi:hypothetical protein